MVEFTVKLGKDTRPGRVKAAEKILEYIIDDVEDNKSSEVWGSTIEEKLWEMLAELSDITAKKLHSPTLQAPISPLPVIDTSI